VEEPLESWRDPEVTSETLCWGSQLTKTTTVMVGLMWAIENSAQPCIWVMPNENFARSFSKTRWFSLIKGSDWFTRNFNGPRENCTFLEQQFDKATMTFVGSNSTISVAGRPAGRLVCDEVDKLGGATEKEADALENAEQRLKNSSGGKAFLTSTPTTEDGRIWTRFLRGDQRRFNIRCPNCKERIKLLWNQVKWDQTAYDKSGWDLERVRGSARYVCQNCKAPMNDSQKVAACRSGIWIPENPKALKGERSRQLSSLYSPSKKCTFGELAVKFLQDQDSPSGLQGFFNGYLGEPWMNQDAPRARREMIVSGIEFNKEADVKFITVDVQAKAPHFWFVVRKWSPTGESVGIEKGSLETWEEVRAKQQEHSIADIHTFPDSGFNATEVYGECLRHGVPRGRPGKVPLWIGWLPMKGIAKDGWPEKESKISVPFYLRGIDPRIGDTTGRGGGIELKLLEFATESTKDILHRLRGGHTGVKWAVSDEMADEEYWRHMDAEKKESVYSARTGKVMHIWRPRSKKWPNHLFDCEVMQVAAAIFHQRMKLTAETPEPKQGIANAK